MRAKLAGVILDSRDLEHDWDQIWDEQSADAEFAAGESVESLKESAHRCAFEGVVLGHWTIYGDIGSLPGMSPERGDCWRLQAAGCCGS
jgi:hypothetical protein